VTPEQRAAFINAAVARALIRAAGMTAENMERATHGHSMAYAEETFCALINEEGIGHNSVVSFLLGDR
jgi:hypothetical protein